VKNFYIICAVMMALGACSSAEKKSQDDAAPQVEQSEEASSEKVADSSDKAEASDSRTECTLDKDVRIIEVRKTDAGGCELFYTKFNEEKSVASSGFGTQYCEEVKDRIQTNLTKAGFSCQ
jgi:ABC-type enterochelin transport system substrate-binding protein